MLCHKCGPNLFFALTIKLTADPLDCREIDLPFGDNQLNVDQVVCASVLLRLAARPVQLLCELMFERNQGDGTRMRETQGIEDLSDIGNVPSDVLEFLIRHKSFGKGPACRLFKSLRHHVSDAGSNRVRHALARDAVRV